MKRLTLPFAVALALMCAFSACKKDETETFGPMSQITKVDDSKKGSTSNLREDDCFYIPFTQTGANTWTVNQNGVNMTFTDLHLKADGRLYGKLASVSSGSRIINGGDDYNGREYAVEIPICTGNYGITKSRELISLVLYTSMYGNHSFVSVNGQGAPGAEFMAELGKSIKSGIPLYEISSSTATITHYNFTSNISSCTGSRLILGKLYAKGVVRHPGPNGTETFTFTELGIASMCLEDEFIAPLPPPPVGPPLPLS